MPDVPATSRVSRDVGWPGPNRPSVGGQVSPYSSSIRAFLAYRAGCQSRCAISPVRPAAPAPRVTMHDRCSP
jgi:hypothetical protein